jgi:hypothetical protein
MGPVYMKAPDARNWNGKCKAFDDGLLPIVEDE